MKPHLRKFLVKKYGTTHTVSQNSILGIYLNDLLDKQYRRQNSKISSDSSYEIQVPKSMVERTGFNINPTKMKRFESFVQKLFRSSLEDYIITTCQSPLVIKKGKKDYKQDVINAMKQFLESFGITEDDLKFESLYRDYNREQTRKKGQPQSKLKSSLQKAS